MAVEFKQRRALGVVLKVLFVVILLCSIGFGGWAFTGMQDYKQNVDKKIADASKLVEISVATAKDTEFAEKLKIPFNQYNGPSAFGSLAFQYPANWSAYVVDDRSGGNEAVAGYFHPNVVPSVTSTNPFALRIRILNKRYDEVVRELGPIIKSGKIKVIPFRAAKVPGILGSRVDGEIMPGKKVSKVILPIRDKTLEIWTESELYMNDFNNIILTSLSFSP